MTERRLPKTAVENLVEDLASKANADLSNLDATGQAKFDAKADIALTNSPYTTNRILEIPQDIKLELNNSTLTLKAGSKVYVPNGFEADGSTPKFDVVTTANDIVYNTVTTTTGKSLFFLYSDLVIGAFAAPDDATVSYYFSGPTAPTVTLTYALWYDTTNNIVKNTHDNGATWTPGNSLPLSVCSYTTGTGVTSIDQVFNGFGYIGSTAFVLPGVKVQTPNGRNADGTYKYVIRTIDSVKIYDAGAWGTRNLNISFSGGVDSILFETLAADWFTYNKKFSSDTATVSYDEDTGLWWFSPNQSSWSQISVNIVGSITVTSGRITSFEPYTVDSVLNSSLSNLSSAGQAKFDAKANVSQFQVVSDLPASPDPNVFYFIPE